MGSYNIERFFDTVDDPLVGEPVLTSAAFANRLNKASLAIRNVMRTPDIVGVEEVENLATLAALAAKINADAVAAGQPDPVYVAYLEEGNDVGGHRRRFPGQDGARRRHRRDAGRQGRDVHRPEHGDPALLNDRPPLVLRATGAGRPRLAVPGHGHRQPPALAERGGDPDARVRAKRAAQAEFLANLIQARQAADPTERIVSVGDYNAFAVNDGYVDVIGTVKGQPTPAARSCWPARTSSTPT